MLSKIMNYTHCRKLAALALMAGFFVSLTGCPPASVRNGNSTTGAGSTVTSNQTCTSDGFSCNRTGSNNTSPGGSAPVLDEPVDVPAQE